jgi:hypothetical protein
MCSFLRGVICETLFKAFPLSIKTGMREFATAS